MRLPRIRPEIAHAARVALAAALLVGIVYAACVTVLDQVVSAKLVESVDVRLADRLSDAREAALGHATADDDDVSTAPVYLWRLTGAGRQYLAGLGAPALPAGFRPVAGHSATVQMAGQPFRLSTTRANGLTLVAGQSLVSVDHLMAVLRDGETLVAPVLLLAMFAGALAVGVQALAPVEQSRRRQLEFTADASHELRTPLSVISAETSIALSTPRKASEYREVLARIQSESERLQKILQDMLWLARFDSAPPQPGHEPLDLATVAAGSADRFGALAAAQQFELEVVTQSWMPAWITAPPEWIDRLAGVLVDNACRYAGPGGKVRVSVATRGNRVGLTVEDSGPGIAPAERPRLFDRFHRSTEQGGSAGLGLAIADSIVRSTAGQWRLDDSELGGALFEVSWRRVLVRQPHGSAPAQASAGGSSHPIVT
ncbi:MAG TPA: HAMP domain-containing sensor histidine kinase [Streptosporangiaceae bacterium]|jgi:signal transduction histidine kinase